MKKLMSLVLIALVSVSALFAQTYNELLAKAKSYEAKKEWVYALGYYYDAANVENAQEEAWQKFDALSKEIMNGNPGFGKFNLFSLHDEWVKLVKNYFKYFTEFCPYDILYDGNLVQDSVDYSTRKAKYKMKYEYIPSEKFTAIRHAIKTGLIKSQTDDWKDVYYGDYDKYDSYRRHHYNRYEEIVYRFPQLTNIEKKYENISNTSGNLKNYVSELTNEIKKVYAENKIAVVYGLRYGTMRLASLSSYTVFADFFNFLDKDSDFSFYDVKFGLYGKNGKLLSSGARQNFSRYNNEEKYKIYFFENVTPDMMNLIDAGEVIVKPLGCYLNYGVIVEDYSNHNSRAILKPLPDIVIGMDKVKFVSIVEKRRAEEKSQAEARRKIEEKRLNNNNINTEMIKIPGKNFEMLWTEVTQGVYESVMGENPSQDKGSDLPVTNVSWYDAIVFCNKLSQMEGYKPVYSVSGETDTGKWNYIPHKRKKIEGEIVQDENANGFRLPTSEEWEYAALGGRSYKYAGSDSLDEVGWYDGNSDGVTHPVATKKPNGYSLYDMSGNVAEWVGDSKSCGGSYNGSADSCEVSNRNADLNEKIQFYFIGFRVVRQTE